MSRYLFREGVNINNDGNNIIISTPYATRSSPKQQTLCVKDAKEPLKKLLKNLFLDGIESNQTLKTPETLASTTTSLDLELQLQALYKAGLLIHEIEGSHGIAMRLLPINPGLKQQPCPDTNNEFKLSRFTSIEPCLEGLDITSPLAPTTLRLQDHRLYPLIQRLVSPCKLASISHLLPEDLRTQYRDIISLFLSSGMVGICNSEHNAEIDQEAIRAGWNKQDLSFHNHTRRHIIDRCQEELLHRNINRPLPPARNQRIILSTVPLPQPKIKKQDADFYQIIRKRQTIRSYNSNPITLEALGNLLWYSVHTREEIICDPALPRSYEGLLRPVASAGGLHSIELYLCIKQCIGIGSGLYHYDSFDHCLGKMSELNNPCQNMLEMAVNTTCRGPQAASISPGQGQQPDVLIVMATRYERNAILHSETGLTYALILKDAGSIYQQLYLVATALGLAPCGLSFGSSELFEQASGIPSKIECSVGEFMIGNPSQGHSSLMTK